MRLIHRLTFWLLTIGLALLLPGCQRERLHQQESYVFGTRVEVITWGAPEPQARAATAAVLAHALREKLGDRVLGPEIPNVSRVNDRYIRNLLVKMRRSAHVTEKQFVSETVDRGFGDPAHSPVRLVIDVDPN